MKFHQLPLLKTIQLNSENWLSSPGVIGTFVLIFIIIFLGVFIFLKRLNRYVDFLEKNTTDLTEEEFQRRLINLEEEDVDNILELRQQGFKTNVKPSNIAETSSKYIGFMFYYYSYLLLVVKVKIQNHIYTLIIVLEVGVIQVKPHQSSGLSWSKIQIVEKNINRQSI